MLYMFSSVFFLYSIRMKACNRHHQIMSKNNGNCKNKKKYTHFKAHAYTQQKKNQNYGCQCVFLPVAFLD